MRHFYPYNAQTLDNNRSPKVNPWGHPWGQAFETVAIYVISLGSLTFCVGKIPEMN